MSQNNIMRSPVRPRIRVRDFGRLKNMEETESVSTEELFNTDISQLFNPPEENVTCRTSMLSYSNKCQKGHDNASQSLPPQKQLHQAPFIISAPYSLNQQIGASPFQNPENSKLVVVQSPSSRVEHNYNHKPPPLSGDSRNIPRPLIPTTQTPDRGKDDASHITVLHGSGEQVVGPISRPAYYRAIRPKMNIVPSENGNTGFIQTNQAKTVPPYGPSTCQQLPHASNSKLKERRKGGKVNSNAPGKNNAHQTWDQTLRNNLKRSSLEKTALKPPLNSNPSTKDASSQVVYKTFKSHGVVLRECYIIVNKVSPPCLSEPKPKFKTVPSSTIVKNEKTRPEIGTQDTFDASCPPLTAKKNKSYGQPLNTTPARHKIIVPHYHRNSNISRQTALNAYLPTSSIPNIIKLAPKQAFSNTNPALPTTKSAPSELINQPIAPSPTIMQTLPTAIKQNAAVVPEKPVLENCQEHDYSKQRHVAQLCTTIQVQPEIEPANPIIPTTAIPTIVSKPPQINTSPTTSKQNVIVVSKNVLLKDDSRQLQNKKQIMSKQVRPETKQATSKTPTTANQRIVLMPLPMKNSSPTVCKPNVDGALKEYRIDKTIKLDASQFQTANIATAKQVLGEPTAPHPTINQRLDSIPPENKTLPNKRKQNFSTILKEPAKSTENPGLPVAEIKAEVPTTSDPSSNSIERNNEPPSISEENLSQNSAEVAFRNISNLFQKKTHFPCLKCGLVNPTHGFWVNVITQELLCQNCLSKGPIKHTARTVRDLIRDLRGTAIDLLSSDSETDTIDVKMSRFERIRRRVKRSSELFSQNGSTSIPKRKKIQVISSDSEDS